ncbi:MAG TPA: lytic transglycosylase domain-containing protein [Anaeromyxobacteraceae bacterium]|nr:lytic transglycosylase domain-containing protein [Anaeromyxobacteraceae bacterium]
MRPCAALLLGVLLLAHPARAAEPLADWLDALGTAVQLLDAGQPDGARAAALRAAAALPAGEAGARAHLAAALAAARDGASPAALAPLRAALPSLPGPLRPFALERLAAAYADAGHPGLAAAAAAEAALSRPALDADRLAVAESRALLRATLAEPAARSAAPAAARGDPAAQLAWADALSSLGDSRAPALYARLSVERAGEPDGEEAARKLAALPGAALSSGDRRARVERLLATAHPRLALAELDAVGAPDTGPAATRALLLRAVALLQLSRPAEAEVLAVQVAGRPDAGPDAAAAEWVLARAAARQGRLEEAAERYRRVASSHPTVPGLPPAQQADLADDSAFLSAWLWYDAGRFEEAARRLARFAAENPGAKRAPDARWFRAWALLRSGRSVQARRAFASLAASETGPLRAAALYWGARATPSSAAAAALYRDAVREAPDGWYALLARARLAGSGLPAPQELPLPPGPPPRAPADGRLAASLALAGQLLGAGLREEALAVLQRAASSPAARTAAAAVAEMAAFAGEVEIPFRMARDHLPPTQRSERWLYPEAYPSVLFPAAGALGLDPWLVLAIMRRESSFRASVRSGAAAEGLLQLRPETAERVAQVLGLSHGGAERLSDPGQNLTLGIAYLGLLGSRFPQPPVLAAAYNAGPVRAAAWSAEGPPRPLDEWVEEIPYRETRHYVRGVMADWARYRHLARLPPPPVDPAEPVRPPADGVAF